MNTNNNHALRVSYQQGHHDKDSSGLFIPEDLQCGHDSRGEHMNNDYLSNRQGGSITSNQPSSESNGATDNGVPCLQVLEWDDTLDERPIVFRIRDYQNSSDHTHYTIEVQTLNYGPHGNWSVKRRYSEFRDLYNALKKLAHCVDRQFYKGLCHMLEKNGPIDNQVKVQEMNQSFSADSSNKQSARTHLNQNQKGQNLFGSFVQPSQQPKSSNIMQTTQQSQYNCIVFPGRKLFKMKQNVITQRMKELAQFLNDLLDTKKCVFSSSIHFNIMNCEEFLKFIEAHEDQESVKFVREEQQKRINQVIKQCNDAIQSLEEIQSPQCAPGVSSSGALSITRTLSKQRGSFISSNRSRSKSGNSITNARQTGDFKTTILKSDSEKFLTTERQPIEQTCAPNDSVIHYMTQMPPNAEQVMNLYKKKSSEKICLTLLENLNSNEVCNKNEHLKQFFSLYQKQSFRIKTDLRLKLFMGTQVSKRKQLLEFDGFAEEDDDQLERPLNGIVQLIGSFQDDQFNGMMQAENLLKFLHDMLDYNSSPQADVFNILFNNLDIYWVFKMKLPEFIRVNSPYKVQAQKLLHQFLVKKPIENQEHIGLFFSEDASYQNIKPIHQETYEQFIRYHKRQLKVTESGLGTNASARLRQSDFSGVLRPRKQMSDPDHLNESIVLLRASHLSSSVIISRRESSFQARLGNSFRIETRPEVSSQQKLSQRKSQSKESIKIESKKDKMRNHIRENIDQFSKKWFESLKDQNKQFHLSRKELIQMDRFNVQIEQAKKELYSIKFSEHDIQKVYRSDFSPKESEMNVALVQLASEEPLETFNCDFLSSLFEFNFDIDEHLPCYDDSLFNQPGFEKSILTSIMVDSQTEVDIVVQIKTFETDTDGFFVIAAISEIDILSKQNTGRYAIIKLSRSGHQKGETDILQEDYFNIIRQTAAYRQNETAWCPLDIIEEAKSSDSPSKESALTASKHFDNFQQDDQRMNKSEISLYQSTILPPVESLPVTKISMIVDWVSADSLSGQNEEIQQNLIRNFCGNLRKVV